MGYKVFHGSLENIELSKKKVVNTINPHSYVTAKKDAEFKLALQGSDVLIPDGSGIVLAAKIINGEKIIKIMLKENTLAKFDIFIKKEWGIIPTHKD